MTHRPSLKLISCPTSITTFEFDHSAFPSKWEVKQTDQSVVALRRNFLLTFAIFQKLIINFFFFFTWLLLSQQL